MQDFAALFQQIDQTQSTNEKVLHMKNFFLTAESGDSAWALFFLSGHRMKRFISSGMLYNWCWEYTGMPDWLMSEKLGAKRCVVVGDLIHAKAGLSEPIVAMFSEWLKGIDCEIDLVIGNHDRSLQKYLPHEWTLHLHKESYVNPPFCFCHFPCQKEGYFVWSGHLHPQIAIRGKSDRVVVRCFHIGKEMAILPAFSSFVGGSFVQKGKDTKIYGIANDKIIEL